MNLPTVAVIIVLIVLIIIALVSIRNKKPINSCSGDCASCIWKDKENCDEKAKRDEKI